MGYVDPALMQTRYWALWIDGAPLPDYMMAALDSMTAEESQIDRTEAVIRFVDVRNRIPRPEGGSYITLNDVATTNGRYLFERGRVVTIAMGYDPHRLVEYWSYVIDKIKPSFPDDGDPMFELRCLSRKQQLRMGRTTTIPVGTMQLKKLSDVVVPIASNHKLSYHIEDAEFDPPVEFMILGTDTDQTILDRLGALYGRNMMVVRDTLVFAHPDKILFSTDNDYRYQLCYRCGDSSCVSFTANEQDRSSRSKRVASDRSDADSRVAYLDRDTGAENLMTLTSDGQYGVADTQQQMSTYYDHEDESLQMSRPLPEEAQEAVAAREAGIIIDTVQRYDSRTGVWQLDQISHTEGETTKEKVVDEKVTQPEQMAGHGQKPTYDAEIGVLMMDPFLRLGVQIEMIGLGVRWSATNGNKYAIRGRKVEMSRDSGPTLTLKISRFRKAKPTAKPAQVPQDDKTVADRQDPYTGNLDVGVTLHVRDDRNGLYEVRQVTPDQKIVQPKLSGDAGGEK